MRQEDPEVFEATHPLALALVGEGLVDGLRIDHPDGLADPAGYLERLRDGGVEHVWVEKILDPGEQLRDWPVEGTVGYEFLNDVAALFVDPAGEAPLTALWERARAATRARSASGRPRPSASRRARTFAPEVEWLRRLWPGVEGLEEALAALPVYRTYVRDLPAREDLHVLARGGPRPSGSRSAPRGRSATRFQQTTPPVMAKGVEDTAFYRYARLLALNDVGGDPSRFVARRRRLPRRQRRARRALPAAPARRPDARHQALGRRARADRRARRRWPRSGPRRVRRWRELCAPLRADGAPDAGRGVPDLPDARRRLADRAPSGSCAYMEKALREAKRNTSWVEPDAGWEERVLAYCRALLRPRRLPRRLRAVRRARRRARASCTRCARRRSSSPSRASPTSTRATSSSRSRSSTPTTAARSTGSAARGCSPSCATAPRPTGRDARKLWLIRALLALRARRARRVRRRLHAARRRAGRGARSCAATTVAVALPLREGGLDLTGSLPAGDWRPAFEPELLPGAQITVLERRS